MNTQSIRHLAIDVLNTEARAIDALHDRIDSQFERACELILGCNGKVVVCGVGKSGHIGGKIAATLASTGTPAFFVHPGEASHGDLGMIRKDDTVLAISNSGETAEILLLLPVLAKIGCPLISMTGNCRSRLATQSTVHLDVSVDREACPLGLAPTSSTTATLALGDALAVALLHTRGFNETDFALSHPGGALGKRLLLTVQDIMVSGTDTPIVSSHTPLKQALIEMSARQLGFLIICDEQKQLAGVFTDGDLRRALDQDIDINAIDMADLMTPGGHSIEPDQMAVDALALMRKHKIMALPVTRGRRVCGALNMHSLFSAGLV